MRLLYVAVIAGIAAGCSSEDVRSDRKTVPAKAVKRDAATKPQPAAKPLVAAADIEALAAPYFSTGPAGAAAGRLALQDYKGARAGFAAALAADKSAKDGPQRARLRLLVAVCDAKLRAFDKAAAGFEYALKYLSQLSDYLHYHAARSYFFTRDWDKSLAHARLIGARAINIVDAKLLIGDVLRIQNKHAEVIAHYKAYLHDHPGGYRRAEAHFRIAEAAEALGKGVPDAVDHYRRITIDWPTSRWAKRAQPRLQKLLKGLPKARRRRYTNLSAAELITRGVALYKHQRHAAAVAALTAALKQRLTPKQRCVAAYHLGNSLFKAKKRREAAPALNRAATACRRAHNANLEVRAHYQAGRAYAYLHKRLLAIAHYREIETAHPKHSFADDARLRQAEEYADLNDQPSVTRVLEGVAKKYPKGDMATEALWRLAWRAYRNKRYAEAVRYLQQQLKLKPVEDNYWAEGQAHYWLARSQRKLGNNAAAVAHYKRAIVDYPLSYYALLAFNRLREDHADAFAAVKTQVAKPPADYDPKQPAFRFDISALQKQPGFRRGLEFLRLGLGKPAEREFAVIGLSAPKGRKPVTDPAKRRRLWLMAFLHDRAGRYRKSHWPTRYHLVKYKRRWPVGQNRARWDIAYPRAFAKLLAAAAAGRGYPTELPLAIVREESAFNPLQVSWANAVGLMQMIIPTAKRFARGTGLTVSRAALRDPATNVRIGNRFLDFLWRKWKHHVGLIPPSYNAGEGATARWLRQRGTWPMDEWAEAIPYDETRRYEKRVLASYFAYSYLKDGTIPVMPNKIDPSLIPSH